MYYSVEEFKKANPNVSVKRDANLAYLAKLGIDCAKAPKPVEHVKTSRVSMYQFLNGLREFGLRVQFEAYILASQGRERDYWFTSRMVHRDSNYMEGVVDYFQLKPSDMDAIWSAAEATEE